MVLLRVAGELFLTFLSCSVCLFPFDSENRPPILYFFGAFNFTLAGFLSFLFRLPTPAHSLSSARPLSTSILLHFACILPTNYAYDSNLPPIVLFSLSPRPPQLLFYLDRANSPKKNDVFFCCVLKLIKR
ncbi:hypothetical protein V8E53_011959 [Lactarius tabidus]